MKVYYRLTAIASTNPSPIYQDNKDELNKLCLKSFVNAYRDINPTVVFLCDYCPKSYESMIDELCPFEHSIVFSHEGINGTALQQFFLAYQQDEDILFQECDYISKPNIGKRMQEGVTKLGLVSPYDHPNFYFDKAIHSDQVTIKLIGDTHWRSTERNTLTFAIRNDIYKETYTIWREYGYLDNQNYKEVAEKGHKLFVPIPSFATHCVASYMAPSVNWKEIWEKHI